MIIKGKTLGAFVRALDTAEPFEHVHITPAGLEGWRDTTEGPFVLKLFGNLPAAPAHGGECIPVRYLRRLAKIAGARNAVGIELPKPAALKAIVKGTTYRSLLVLRDRPPDRSDINNARSWRASSAEFRRGGAVNVAASSASKSDDKPELNAVHLDAVVTGTDGCQLTQRQPVTDLAGLDALVPLPAVDAVKRLVDATRPDVVECHRGKRWIRFRADGWEVLSPLVPAKQRPDYAKVTARGEKAATMIAVDSADLRELWQPFRRQKVFHLAVYRCGGLLVWGDAESGIGTTLDAVPVEPPAFVFGKETLPGLSKMLPKSGKLVMAVIGREQPARIAGQVVMGCSVQVPDCALDSLQARDCTSGTAAAAA